MERKEVQNGKELDSAFSILALLSDELIQVQGPDGEGRYMLASAVDGVPEGAARVLEALEGMDSLRVPAERLGKDLRRFLKDRDLTGGGLLLLAGLRLFFIRREGPDAYGILMDRRFQETVPLPEVRLEHLIAALRSLDGEKGLFRAPVRRIYRAVELPGILLEENRPRPLGAEEVRGLPTEGKIFVLAGGLSREERTRAKELIAVQGGRCASALSGRTDYLAAGSSENLRETTLMQFQALQTRGRKIVLLDRFSLFSLLGEKLPENPLAIQMEKTSSIPEKLTSSRTAELPETPPVSFAESLPVLENSASSQTAESLTVSAESLPVLENSASSQTAESSAVSVEFLPVLENSASSQTAESSAVSVESLPVLENSASTQTAESTEIQTVISAESLSISGNSASSQTTETGHSAADFTTEEEAAPVSESPLKSVEVPEAAEKAELTAPEGIQAAVEQSWEAAWESAREEEARAIAEAAAEVARLQEARAEGERRLHGLGLLKFSERAAARQELQKLNQSLRTAEAELSRLNACMKRTAT